ncbi:MAG TPA: hypothetical protein VED67_03165 [Thermodesulfovibrionales bacterium]|nr:hypothetical protein [Thermodesulfovibrionales bacterium]
MRIDHVGARNGRPVLFSNEQDNGEFDLVVGAFGVNSTAAKLFEEAGFGYKEPPTITAAIGELRVGEDAVSEYF